MNLNARGPSGGMNYPIHFGSGPNAGILAHLTALERAGRNQAVLIDSTLARLQGARLRAFFSGLPWLRLSAGETAKSMTGFARVLDFLARQQIDRSGVLWIVGGGVTGDLGGFAAATYLRGIDCIQVPTTLLAMVDSSVGGKTGINLPAGKNLAGAFHPPRAVFIATDFLRTLPRREFAAGTAEIIKAGLLGDAGLFAELERAPLTPGSRRLPAIIRRSCRLKMRIVRADEREQAAAGGRALLNLGHTFGHAIEQVTRFRTYRHGEAVAIGLVGAALLSQKLGLLSATAVQRVRRTVAAHRLPVRLRAPLPLPALRCALAHDKKNRGGRPRFIVLERIGRAVVRAGVPSALVDEVWRDLGARG